MVGQDKQAFKIWCWIVTGLYWISIIAMIYSLITSKKSENPAEDTSSFAVYYFVGMAMFYFVTESVSSTCCYLLHPSTGGTIYQYMEKLFSTPAHHVFYVKCYHYETKTVQVRDAQGNVNYKTEQEKVYTHEASEKFYYTSWRDISGRFVLDTTGAMANTEKAYVQLHLKIDLQYANDGTKNDLERQRRSFYWRNQRDVHQDQHEEDELDGFIEFNLVKVTDFNPKYFGLSWYILSMILTVCEFYKMYVNKFCIEQDFTISKIVSSKDGLQKPEFLVQYQQLLPCIVYMGQTKTYDINFVAPQLVLPSYEFQVSVNAPAVAIASSSITMTAPAVTMTAPALNVTMPAAHIQVNEGGATMQMQANVNMPGIQMSMNAPLLH